MSISRTYLNNHCMSPTTYFKGASYYTNNRVHILSDFSHKNGQRTVEAEVSGNGQNIYHASITLASDESSLKDYECECPAFSTYDGLCKHLVALSLAVNDQDSQQKLAPVITDSAAVQLIRHYAQKLLLDASAVTSVAQEMKLTATLSVSDNTPSITLKVGSERMYVVKDFAAFLGAVRNGETLSYGKQLSFAHHPGAFNEESAGLLQFLLTYYDNRNATYAQGNYYSSTERSRNMFLSAFMLDAFIQLHEGRHLTIETGRKTADYLVCKENPRLRLHIDAQDNGSYVLRIPKSFFLIMGNAHLYLGCDNRLYCCDTAYSTAMRAFFRSMRNVSGHQFVIAERDMPTFTATLLPALEPYVSIVSDTTLSVFESPALQSQVYFDMPKADFVTARLEHHYGDKFHLGFQQKDLRQSFDLKGETKSEMLLLRYLKPTSSPGIVEIQDDEDALYQLADHGVTEIAECAQVFATDAFKSMRVKPPAAVNVGVRVESNLLRLHFDVQGLDLAELEQVLASYRKAKKYHRLRDGSFLNLADSTLSEVSELTQGLDLTAKEMMSGELSVPKYRALYLDNLLKQSERIQYDRDGAFKQMIRDVRDVSDADYEIPKSLRHILRNYQKTGYRWLRTLATYGFGGILADDMGLGKTLQVIALLLAQKEEQTAHTASIVVCPSSLVLNWQSEALKFAPALHVAAVTGSAAQREDCIKSAQGTIDLLITSYDSLKRDIDLYTSMSFKYVIADEAQYMKNQNTQNAKAVKTLQATVRLALTGTPVENSLAEVWSIFDFLMPGYLYHYAKFRKSFETPIVKQGDKAVASTLRKMVSPFILRRMKKDVLKELPDKIETVLYAELEDEQNKLYMANVASAKKELESGLGDSGTDKLQILALLTRLRQICCDPALVYEDYAKGSAKLELCMELLQRCIDSGHRVLLFSQFTSMLSRIAVRLEAIQRPFFTITGETKVSERLDLVNAFNEGDTPVFLISLKAGGTGLNLTGADVVIHYDPWWNNSAQNQASDRAHRIGQTKTVQVYKLIVKNSLEERILEMQKSKSDLADMIVREGDGAFARMSKAELLALFE